MGAGVTVPVFRVLAMPALLVGLAAVTAPAQWSRAPVLRPEILAEIPHDTGAFTQGLLWLNGDLYESTGLYGESSLRRVDARTGAVLRRQKLPATTFAEGLAWFQGSFIQLTWQEGRAFRYSMADWKKPTSRFKYAGEGWGLTAIGASLWMSNGSDTLYRRDAGFRITGRSAVRWDGRPVARLNELEAAGGRIVANVWYSDSLFIIDPANGRVLAVVDASGLAARSGRRSADEVLNGIAYDPAKKVFYLTGKKWPKMFKVRIPFHF
jgi:glutamine cyclotransferase